MNIGKTKTAIIILLLAANIYFLGSFYILRSATMTIPQKMADDTAEIINTRAGMEIIDSGIIPREKPVHGIFEGEYLQEEYFNRLISNIAGEEAWNNLHTYSIPGAFSFAAGQYRFCFGSPDKDEQFSVSVLNVEYSSGGLEEYANTFSKDIIDTFKIPTSVGLKSPGTVKKAVGAFLKKSGASAQEFGILASESDGDIIKAAIVQKFGSIPLDSHLAYVEISGGEVTFFSGRWYFGEIHGDYTAPLLDAVNILFKSLDSDRPMYNGAYIIVGISESCAMLWHEPNKFYVYPAWRIEFNDGRFLYYNMISGEKISV